MNDYHILCSHKRNILCELYEMEGSLIEKVSCCTWVNLLVLPVTKIKVHAFLPVLQSLKSCGYVKEQFAWRHFYWYLTNEGIQYLRDFLHLPPEIVPATLRRQTRPETARPRPKGEFICQFFCCGVISSFLLGLVCSLYKRNTSGRSFDADLLSGCIPNWLSSWSWRTVQPAWWLMVISLL